MTKPNIIHIPNNREYVSLVFRKSSIPKIGINKPKFQKVAAANGNDFFAFKDGSTLEIGLDQITYTTGSADKRTIRTLTSDGTLEVKKTGFHDRPKENTLYHPNSPLLDEPLDEHEEIQRFAWLRWCELGANHIQDMIFTVFDTNSEIPEKLKSFTEFKVVKPAQVSTHEPKMG